MMRTITVTHFGEHRVLITQAWDFSERNGLTREVAVLRICRSHDASPNHIILTIQRRIVLARERP